MVKKIFGDHQIFWWFGSREHVIPHFARQDRQDGNLKNKQNHATKVTKIRKNEVTKMT